MTETLIRPGFTRHIARVLEYAEAEGERFDWWEIGAPHDSKTEAGIRLVDILPGLRDELGSHRHANADEQPNDLVVPTSTGSRRDKDNARERVIRPVVRRADELLSERGHQPLPQGVTAHKLRHTFASILECAARTRPT